MSEKTTINNLPSHNHSSYRYPGAQPFGIHQESIFFGRNEDINALIQLINIENLIVLHSKSGLGKSSLLNAGIIPKIKQQKAFIPIPIRLGPFMGEKAANPIAITRQLLVQYFRPEKTLLDKLAPDDLSIWYQLKKQSLLAEKKGIILFFDQFEELFTYSKKAITAFKAQLVEILNTTIPQTYRSALEAQFKENPTFLSDTEMELLHEPLKIKIVMAIRSDRMSLMDQLSDYLPKILSNCYELDALSPSQAEDAILNPAFLDQNGFLTPPFDYQDEAIEAIIKYLTEDYAHNIESFQLQILCQSIEQKVIAHQLREIQLTHLGDFQSIYKNYYQDQVALLGNVEDQKAARLFLEEGLIFEEEERRLSIYEGQIYKTYNISPELLRRLVNTHLLRSEPSMKGGYTYELSHDTLVGPVLQAKQRRKAAEKEKAEEIANIERAKEIQALKAEANLERKKRRQARFLAGVGFFLFFTTVGMGVFTYYQIQENERTKKQTRLAAERRKKEFNQFFEEGKDYFNQGNFEVAKTKFEQALVLHTNYPEAKDYLNQCNEKIKIKGQFQALWEQGSLFEEKGQLIAAIEKYREADNLGLEKEKINQKLANLSNNLENTFLKHLNAGDIFYNAANEKKGFQMALERYRKAVKIKPQNKAVQQKIILCKAAIKKLEN